MNHRIFSGAVCLLLSCNEPHLPDITQEGAHIIVSSDPGLLLCGGSLGQMDEFISLLSHEFSTDPPVLSDRIDFNWLVSEDFSSRTSCNEAFVACARRPHTVYSKYAPANHELVHAVAFAIGHPPSFFAEGLATAYQGLGGGIQSFDLASFDQDVRPLLEMSGVDLSNTPGGYELAGGFTAFLITRFGIRAYLQVYAEMDREAEADVIDGLFLENFGVGLEASVSGFEASTIFSYGQAEFDAKLVECGAPGILWDGVLVEQHRSIACDQEDVVGPSGGGTAVVFQTIDIDKDDLYELRVVGDPTDGTFSGVSMQCCGGCISQINRLVSVEDPARLIQLEAGRYSFRLHGSALGETSVGFRLRRVEEIIP